MTTYNHNPRTLDDETANNTIREAAPQLLAALIDLTAALHQARTTRAPAGHYDEDVYYNGIDFSAQMENALEIIRTLTA